MLLLWDLDGTLLTTSRAGLDAWREGLLDVTGVDADLESFETAGHPDFGIARRLLEEVAGVRDPAADTVQALVARYEALLPCVLPRRRGRVLPNVRDILERLAADAGVHMLLLTGNTRRGAAAKLAHYGLDGFLGDGGFSSGAGDRVSIARSALARAHELWGPTDLERTFVIGDTPHDVHCGQAIGARTVAVATGVHDVARLAATGPWRVVRELPPPDGFLALLEGGATGT